MNSSTNRPYPFPFEIALPLDIAHIIILSANPSILLFFLSSIKIITLPPFCSRILPRFVPRQLLLIHLTQHNSSDLPPETALIMDDVSAETSSEEPLIAKKKTKLSFFQKLRRTWVCMIEPLRASYGRSTPHPGLQANIGVRRRARIGDLFRRKRHAPRECSDQWRFYPNQDRLHNGKNAQQSRSQKNHTQMHFHLPHPKLRFHFHVPYRLNVHSHSHHFAFQESSTKDKDNSLHPHALPKDVPKGFLPVYVGEEHQRFVIPVFYLNHPLFGDLLKGTEEEFGFEHKGALLIPCEVSDFELLRSRIGQKHSCKSRTSHCGTNVNGNQEENGDLQCLLTPSCRGSLHYSSSPAAKSAIGRG